MLTQHSLNSAHPLAIVLRGFLLTSIALVAAINPSPSDALPINNSGTININSGNSPYTLLNGDILNNLSAGIINISGAGVLKLESGGVVNNQSGGTVNDDGNILNDSLLNLKNAGDFNVNASGTVTGTGSLVQTAGTLTVLGTVTQSAVNISGGILQGTGTITAPVTITGGTVSPGNGAAGTVTVANNFVMNNGTVNIEIGGVNSGQYDFINITNGAATFAAATIHFSFISGYTPSVGDTVNFLTASTGITGFSNLIFDYSALLSGFNYSVATANTDHSLRFTVQAADVPEPGSFALFGLGLGVMVWPQRKRPLSAV